MTKQTSKPGTTTKTGASHADNRVAQRHQKQSQAGQLSSANAEESPHMDRGDSAEGAGESLSHGRDDAPKPLRRGALDTQYGTRSSMKTGGQGAAPSSADAAADTAKDADRAPQAPNPGSSEESAGAERDTMTTSRPGSGS